MKFEYLIFLLINQVSFSVEAQHNIKNPLICHDQSNFLTCYNDGQIILKFANGNFKEFINADSTVKYSEANRSVTLYKRANSNPVLIDTVYIQQLAKSVMLKKGGSNLEIISLTDIPEKIREFHVRTYSVNNKVEGIEFYSGGNSFIIEIWTFGKTWSWSFKMWQENQLLKILYSPFKHNRLSLIFIKDFDLKYGMSVGTNFRSHKKINSLKSVYTDTMTYDGKIVIGDYPLDKYYYYYYNKRGKLKYKPPVAGELKLCDCN